MDFSKSFIFIYFFLANLVKENDILPIINTYNNTNLFLENASFILENCEH